MSTEISFIPELLAAARAFVQFAVNSHVSIQKNLKAKSLAAVLTLVRFAVISDVSFKTSLICKSLAAVLAFVRSRVVGRFRLDWLVR